MVEKNKFNDRFCFPEEESFLWFTKHLSYPSFVVSIHQMAEANVQKLIQVSDEAVSLDDLESQDTNRHDAVSFEKSPATYENLPLRPNQFPSTKEYLLDIKQLTLHSYWVRYMINLAVFFYIPGVCCGGRAKRMLGSMRCAKMRFLTDQRICATTRNRILS